MKSLGIVVILLVVLPGLGCTERDPLAWVDLAVSESGGQGRALEDSLYKHGCASCHGDAGGGDGPMMFELSATATNFRYPQWQRTTTDAVIDKAMIEGGEAVGLSNQMPAFPFLADRPEIVTALRKRIRRFGESPSR